MTPEQSQQEWTIEEVVTLKARFAKGQLSELQPLQQWVVWKAELDCDGKREKGTV